MNFQDFIASIPKIIDAQLLGELAHLKMVPPERADLIADIDFNTLNPKKSAVLMLLYPKNDNMHLVLIKRNVYKGTHSAQISFPGGKFEADDMVFENTALRETFEEVGVPANTVQIIRAFTQTYIPPSNFMVYPYLGFCQVTPIFIPDLREVGDIIELAIDDLLDEKLCVNKRLNTSYSIDIEVPCFEIAGHLVWGATAMILSELKETLKKF